MNLVELELDETLADFEIQDWIDNIFSVQFPDIKAKIKKCCNSLCQKKLEWHNVKDCLPKEDTKVFIKTKNGNIYTAMIDSSDKCWCMGEYFENILCESDIEKWCESPENN